MTAKSHPSAMRFIPDQLERDFIPGKSIASFLDSSAKEPVRYALLV